MAVVLLVVTVGAGVGVGTVAFTHQRNEGPMRRPLTPSVVAFHFPTQGVVHPASLDAPSVATVSPDSFAEPASARAALAEFLGAERDGLTADSFRLLSHVDQQDVGSADAWAASLPDRPRPLTFAVGPEQVMADGEQITVAVTRRPSLDQFAGLVSARATQVWHVVHEGANWRVGAEPMGENPALPPIAAAPDVANRWVQASAASNWTAAGALTGIPNLTGPMDLLLAPCGEHGSWTATGPAITLDQAEDTQAFVEAYGPDAGTWMRLVPVRGPHIHFLAAVAPLGDDWRVVGVTTDGG
jgi:hypothetical protein